MSHIYVQCIPFLFDCSEISHIVLNIIYMGFFFIWTNAYNILGNLSIQLIHIQKVSENNSCMFCSCFMLMCCNFRRNENWNRKKRPVNIIYILLIAFLSNIVLVSHSPDTIASKFRTKRGKMHLYGTYIVYIGYDKATEIWITDNVYVICFFCTFEKRQKKWKKNRITMMMTKEVKKMSV